MKIYDPDYYVNTTARAISLFYELSIEQEAFPHKHQPIWDKQPQHIKDIFIGFASDNVFTHVGTGRKYSWDRNNQCYELLASND